MNETFLLIRHPLLPYLLLERTPDGWGLPGISLSPYEAREICLVLRRWFGSYLFVIQCIGRFYDRERSRWMLTFLAEGDIPPPRCPQAWQWVENSQVENRHWLHLWQKDLINTFLSSRHIGAQGQAPWKAKGWFCQLFSSIDKKLALIGYSRTREPWQVHFGPFSSVFCIPTSQGRVYLKQCFLFKREEETQLAHRTPASEVLLTLNLSRILPQFLLCPLVASMEEGWMLLPEVQSSLADHLTSSNCRKTLSHLSRFQQASTSFVDQLLLDGFPDRRLAHVPRLFDQFLDEKDALAFVPKKEQTLLRESKSYLWDVALSLERLKIPQTVVHGDFHPGNVGLRDAKPVFFDWSDACIGHPFLDSSYFCASHRLSRIPLKEGQGLCHLYLRRWLGYESMPRLLEALTHIRVLGKVMRAMSCRECLPFLEPCSAQPFQDTLIWQINSLLSILKEKEEHT